MLIKRYFTKPKEPARMRWQNYDWTTLKILNDYRFLTSPILHQLVKLQHPNLPFETFKHRITILWRAGFLERPKEQVALMVRSDDFHITMCLSKAGAEALAYHFGLDEEKLSWRAEQEKVGFRLLEHQLSVAKFRATVELSKAFKILFWLSDGEYYQTIYFRPSTQEQKRITEAEYIGAQIKETIRPDSFFGLANDGRVNFYALEIDRGTQILKTMARKYLAYYKLIKNLEREPLKIQNQEIKHLRVLTISPDESKFENPGLRIKHLKEQTRLIDEKEKGHRSFWFTTEDKIDWQNPKTISTKIWQTPLEEKEILSLVD
jgi:hypothetical protein